MKAIYFLPIFSINLFAHINNTIHYHMIEFFINTIVLFAYISLGLTIALIVRAIYRRFV
tara:strand:- start:343 stop:519 length:177 start_codon:yes stop_codon:yes gene_type:complete